MKATYLFITIGSLAMAGLSNAQEGNSAFRDILENRQAQEALKTFKDNPEDAIRAASQSPEELVRSMTAIYADQSKKTDPSASAVPAATRSKRSTTDKALSKINGILAQPVDSSTQAMPVPNTDFLKNYNVDRSKIDRATAAVKEVMPEVSNLIPNDKPIAPKITGVPSIPETKAVERPTPRINAAAMRPASPLNVSARQAPPAPIRSMEPTKLQIPDTPELYASAVPQPQPLSRRYPKPDKFRPALAAKPGGTADKPKPKSDTMVITSSESEMDNKNHLLTFTGDVLVEMDGMEMTCDILKVHLNDKNEMKKIVATGGTVEIKKIGEGGKLQVAKAKKAEHIAATNTTTLSGGPPFLQNGDQYVNTDSEDSRIILGGDGKYRVSSPKAVGRTVIVVPIGNSKKFTGDLGVGSKLKGIGQ